MENWVALSDRDDPLDGADAGTLMAEGSFILEFDLPLERATVLIDHQTTENWPRAFSVFVDDQAGVVILHRQGKRLLRHVLPGPLDLHNEGSARIVFSWDGPARNWVLRLEQPGLCEHCTARGRDPLPLYMQDFLEICQRAEKSKRHYSVLWFGVKRGETPPERAPWVGLQTPIETSKGPRSAGSLKPGDMIVTAEGNLVPLVSAQRMVLPSRGSFSPVLLRAPYFGNQMDLLVSSDQLVALSGPEVEYLFGEEEVLTEARYLTDGRAAMKDLRRAVTTCVSLDIGGRGLLNADGCPLMSHHHAPSEAQLQMPYRVLLGYETIPLLALLGRGIGRNVA